MFANNLTGHLEWLQSPHAEERYNQSTTSSMRTFQYFMLLLIVLIFNSCGKDIERIDLFPIKAGDRWGYVDKKGQYVINSQFLEAYNFSDGLALVKSTDEKYGYIGEDGKYVINPIYKDGGSFAEGLACVVMENGKPQFIDKNDKIQFTIDDADLVMGFTEGRARVRIKGKWGFIDKSGILTINPIYDQAKDFREGLAAVAQKSDSDNETLWGYINTNGAVKINFQFREDSATLFCTPGSFSGGLAFVSTNGKDWGCIDKDGKYQVNPQFEGVFANPYMFINKLSVVSQRGNYGYLDKQGKYAVNPQFKMAKRFASNGLAAVQNSDGKWGFINKDGRYEINPQFDDVSTGFFGEVAFVQASNKYGIIDNKGRYVANPQFDEVKLLDKTTNLGVYTDFLDYTGIAKELFGTSNGMEHLGYGKTTTLRDILDKYPDLDVSDFEIYRVTIEEPKIETGDGISISSLRLGFDAKTYTESPVYKTVQKYDYYYRRYYNDKEFVRMEKRIQPSAPLAWFFYSIDIERNGAGKGKALARAINDEAAARMSLNVVNVGVSKNTDIRGIFLLENSDIIVRVMYEHYENDKNRGYVSITVVNSNLDDTFDEVKESFIKGFNEQ